MNIPWSMLIAFGIGVLRLSPDQFWRLTLRELSLSMNAHQPNETITFKMAREKLDALIMAYPDEKQG